ncbi:hypothetical protein BZG73_03560 [Salinivibrio siamensis]|uniref:Uncharacterized protein n=1 Tax=Salinivibrio siamensis TaxID=414286 RepID=A0ABX3KDE7_9GAMM|nr:hypothetical protein BZG73_03560 [Salinivibrio siamensis]
MRWSQRKCYLCQARKDDRDKSAQAIGDRDASGAAFTQTGNDENQPFHRGQQASQAYLSRFARLKVAPAIFSG